MKQERPDELESWLKERADQYLLYPSDRVWKNIYKGIHPNRRWMSFSLLMLVFFSASTFLVIEKRNQASIAIQASSPERIKLNDIDLLGKILEQRKMGYLALPDNRSRRMNNEEISAHALPIEKLDPPSSLQQNTALSSVMAPEALDASNSFVSTFLAQTEKIESVGDDSEDKKTVLGNAIEAVVERAKQIRKKANFQFYVTPTVGYRSLSGKASNASFQYSQIFLSNNALFARDVKDAVNHSPGMGIEIGSAMLYPLSKKLTFRAGLQANYTQYKIRAFSAAPEIANYGMNNYGYGSRPISTLSYYRNNGNYSNTTLRNEHYMISVPVGLDYVVAGNKKINLAIGSTIQPTYVFAQYSYLISTNLKNYAKEPSLNRRWNINSAVEASLNITSGDFKWSIAPQYRYQLISSFKDKYPIKENLMDFGIKLGIVKTIH